MDHEVKDVAFTNIFKKKKFNVQLQFIKSVLEREASCCHRYIISGHLGGFKSLGRLLDRSAMLLLFFCFLLNCFY